MDAVVANTKTAFEPMEIIGEIIVYVFLKPFFSVCQALAGILQPTQNPRLLRAKTFAVVFLTFGVVAILASIVSPFCGSNVSTWLSIFLVGFICLAIASAIGHHIEKEVNKEPCEESE